MQEVDQDRLVLIRIAGMHCHKCEQRIVDALRLIDGVREVEVDFASGQASVLVASSKLSMPALIAAVTTAGYSVEGFSQTAGPG